MKWTFLWSNLNYFNTFQQFQLNLHSVRQHDQLGGVVEHHTHSLVAQLIPKSILVAVVYPFADPENRMRSWIAVFIAQVGQVTLQLCIEQIRQLLVQHFQVHLLIVAGRRHHSWGGDCVVQIVLKEWWLVVWFVCGGILLKFYRILFKEKNKSQGKIEILIEDD